MHGCLIQGFLSYVQQGTICHGAERSDVDSPDFSSLDNLSDHSSDLPDSHSSYEEQ